MIIEKNLKQQKINNIGYDDYYFEKENIQIKFYSDMMVLTDLENALKTGKEVKRYNIKLEEENFDFRIQDFKWNMIKVLYKNKIDFESFIIDILKNNFSVPDFDIEIKKIKGVKIFSPFIKKKKINVPKKWTVRSIINAVLSNQIKKIECKQLLTDDYYYDNEKNFGKGEVDKFEFCKDIIESPSGWKIRENKREGDKIELSINCYTFNYNKAVFEI